MNLKSRTLGCLAGVAAATVLAIPLIAVPAQAEGPWWPDPNSCTGIQTATSRVVSGRTVEIRYGWCGGQQYGWGRILGYDPYSNDHIRFEIDANGNRVPDGVSAYRAGDRNYTMGFLTSPSPDRAFRACYVTSASTPCNSSNSTAWW